MEKLMTPIFTEKPLLKHGKTLHFIARFREGAVPPAPRFRQPSMTLAKR
jgi:hypothetical protein